MCLRNKPTRHKPYGKLQPIPPPDAPWKIISWDFIQGLPLSRDEQTNTVYNEVLAITCKFTKESIFEPWNNTWGAKELAHVFTRRVFSQHGLPEIIISDRDSLFTSHFWTSLMSQLGTKLKIATKSHAQTDGQTERLNQTLEIYLRCFLNYNQNDWVHYLPLAEFTYNSSKHSVTGMSPFEASQGRNPISTLQPITPKKDTPEANNHIKTMANIRDQLQKDLTFVMERMSYYYDKKHSKQPSLKEGNRVYLLGKNITTKRPSQKLDYQKLGPYIIKKKLSDVSYELELTSRTRIHPVFHVSLLEPVPDKLRQTAYEQEIDSTIYQVEEILDDKLEDGIRKYLIKWENYGPEDNTWEPAEQFDPKLIQEYHQTSQQGPVEKPLQRSLQTHLSRKTRRPIEK
jgi:hypothetical protein